MNWNTKPYWLKIGIIFALGPIFIPTLIVAFARGNISFILPTLLATTLLGLVIFILSIIISLIIHGICKKQESFEQNVRLSFITLLLFSYLVYLLNFLVQGSGTLTPIFILPWGGALGVAGLIYLIYKISKIRNS